MEIKRGKKTERSRRRRIQKKEQREFLLKFDEGNKRVVRVRDVRFTNTVLGEGNGSVVLEGELTGGVKVAVKRVSSHLSELIKREIEHLQKLEKHKNILQYYGTVEYQPFTDIILELCTCNLKALIDMFCRRSDTKTPNLNSVMKMSEGIHFWKEGTAHVSTDLKNFMRGIVDGIHQLHRHGIIHRDIKPQNILIKKDELDRSLYPKIADMGISKFLPAGKTSLTCTSHGLLTGTFSWSSPEVLEGKRLTQAADIFSMGCVLFFCITRGKHPFDSDKEREENIEKHQLEADQGELPVDLDRVREENIKKNQVNLTSIKDQLEAHHLIQCLLDKDHEKRPTTYQILKHPFFWTAKEKLDFLKAASDRVSKAVINKEKELTSAVEGCLDLTIDPWDKKLDPEFLHHMFNYKSYKSSKKKRRSYNYRKVKDLLRIIRNGLTHFDRLPPSVQATIGNSAEAQEMYFSSKFPCLLFNVYRVLLYQNFQGDVVIDKYKWDDPVDHDQSNSVEDVKNGPDPANSP